MKKTIPVIGMACVVCAANVENTLRKLRGVNSATVTLSTRTVLVDYDPEVITLDDMKKFTKKLFNGKNIIEVTMTGVVEDETK